MAYADTSPVTVTTAWTQMGTSPLGFSNDTRFQMEVRRKSSGSPAATDKGVPLDYGKRYENSASSEVVFARLIADVTAAAPSASVLVDQWS